MSLEAKIEALTEAVTALTLVLTTPDRLAAAAPAPAKTKGTPKTAPAAALVAATSPTPEAAPVSQPAAAPKEEAIPAGGPVKAAHTAEDVRAAAIKLGQVKGREALLTMLTGFGVSKTPELPPHQYASFIAKANAEIAAKAAA